jgi:uncharacterized damage-inducible protein DinB
MAQSTCSAGSSDYIVHRTVPAWGENFGLVLYLGWCYKRGMTTATLLRTLPLSALLSLGLYAQSSPATIFKTSFLAQLDDVEKKIVSLAETMPQEKYSWRPEEGVRSISEVYMHIAGANYLFVKFLGAKMPEGLDPKMEKNVTEKAKVVEMLKASFELARNTVNGLSDADMVKETKFFGGKMMSYESILFAMANHMHEHLVLYIYFVV